MKWNTYQDMENRAYSGILTTLFPEQTKTLPRILVWSVIFLLDLILIIGAAAYWGLLRFGQARSTNDMLLPGGLLFLAIVGVFWLQGKLWGLFTQWLKNLRQNLRGE